MGASGHFAPVSYPFYKDIIIWFLLFESPNHNIAGIVKELLISLKVFSGSFPMFLQVPKSDDFLEEFIFQIPKLVLVHMAGTFWVSCGGLLVASCP